MVIYDSKTKLLKNFFFLKKKKKKKTRRIACSFCCLDGPKVSTSPSSAPVPGDVAVPATP